VEQADKYAGWADSRFLRPVTGREAEQYRRHLNGVVAVAEARVYDQTSGRSVPPHFAYFGTPLWISPGPKGFTIGRLPDGSRLLFRQKQIRPFEKRKNVPVSPVKLIAQAGKFLGVPYLWGGITPAGFDCSGMVQAVFRSFGIFLPRDTKDQISVGRKVERSDIRAGDLLFFKRHVALAVGKDRIIHASVGGGGVRINSLKATGNDYREDLDRDFVTARRIL